MRVIVGMAACLCTAVLSAACSSPPQVEDRSASSAHTTSSARASLVAIERGAPAKVGWFRGAAISPSGGGRTVRLEVSDREKVRLVVAYRGGYLAAVYTGGQSRSTAQIFDARGLPVRRLDGCVDGPVSSTDADLVAWISRPCGTHADRLLHVGPRDDLAAPDQEQHLPAWDGLPAQPSAVGEWGTTVQLSDGMRGYPEAVYVAKTATGEVRRVPGTAEVISVSPQGIACCARPSTSLIDLSTIAVLGRSPGIEAWSLDGTEGLVSRGIGRRVDVVDTDTGTVVRRVRMPDKVDVGVARWEDADNLLFEVGRYDPTDGNYYSTLVRVSASGAVQRVTGVTRGNVPHFL